jgi:hypothetical protein
MNIAAIHIVQSALETIQDECWNWRNQGKECGGSLLGTYIDGCLVILFALRTGGNAEQSYAGLRTDNDYQNRLFQRIFEHYPSLKGKLRYLADYHLHPMYCPRLSATDHRQCYEILTDSDYGLEELPIILVTYNQGQEVLCPFLVSLSANEQVLIEEAHLEIIQSDDPMVREILQDVYVGVDDIAHTMKLEENTRESAIPDLVGQSVFQTQFGEELLESEKAEIHQLTGSEPELTTLEGGVICMTFNFGNIEFRVVFPPEYPLNGPNVLLRTDETGDFELIKPSFHWNSLCAVYDIVREVIQDVDQNHSNDGKEKEDENIEVIEGQLVDVEA